MADKVPIPEGYRHLEAHVERLLSDSPDFDRNVFLIMRFLDTAPMAAIHVAVKSALAARGLCPLRADDKVYHPELWGNLCTYMLGCSKAVAVFEDIELREFNPNVALELGFMLAANKPCLILKEKMLRRPPTDIIGHLWRQFDSFNPVKTISDQVSLWLVDIGWHPRPRSLPKPVSGYILDDIAAFHRILEVLSMEFDLEITYDEVAAQTFAEMTDAVATQGSIFRDDRLISTLASDDRRMARLLITRRRVASLYLGKVLRPLNNKRLSSETRIRKAHAGVHEVLAADRQLIATAEGILAGT